MAATTSMPMDLDDDDLSHAPAEVRERVWNLEAAADAAYAHLRAALDKVDELRPEVAAAERDVRELEKAADDGKLLRRSQDDTYALVPDSDRLAAAQRRLEEVKLRRARETERREALAAIWAIHASRHRDAVDYLKANGRKKLLAIADPVEVELGKGETLSAAVARVRDELVALKKEARSLTSGPGSIEEARAQARQIVEEIAGRGTPDVSPLFTRATTIRWPMWSAGGVSVNGTHLQKIDGAAMLVAMFKDQFIGWLDELIGAHGATLSGMMTAAQRSARLGDIAEETLDLGYQEQALLDRAASEGGAILPRKDADVLCVLMLSPDSPAPRANP